jgi:hypothetical protein
MTREITVTFGDAGEPTVYVGGVRHHSVVDVIYLEHGALEVGKITVDLTRPVRPTVEERMAAATRRRELEQRIRAYPGIATEALFVNLDCRTYPGEHPRGEMLVDLAELHREGKIKRDDEQKWTVI